MNRLPNGALEMLRVAGDAGTFVLAWRGDGQPGTDPHGEYVVWRVDATDPMAMCHGRYFPMNVAPGARTDAAFRLAMRALLERVGDNPRPIY